MTSLEKISERLSKKVSALSFAEPVAYVYNPLQYAIETHRDYLRKYGQSKGAVLFLGMNPGPWGMLQTGVPFGQVDFVKDWLKIEGRISRPEKEHPKRIISGFDCHRREVSGERLWQWIKDAWGTPETFFQKYFVYNYCPLGFLVESGANHIPEKLPANEREALFSLCDQSLLEVAKALESSAVIGIGKFAEKRAKTVLKELKIPVHSILHPSPASPAANRGWARQATSAMHALDMDWP